MTLLFTKVLKAPPTNPNSTLTQQKKYLIVIAGPTAVGKTAMAIEVARHFHAEIISADSRQFYKEMEIGTAKPSPEELAAVRHHFVNNLSIHTKNYSAGKYEAEVLAFLEDYFKSNQIAVMTGGSGLFINAVCNGFDAFEKTDEQQLWTVRNFLNGQTLEWLQQETERLDPEYFSVVDKKNPARLKRGLEILFTTGKKYSEQRIGKKAERDFDVIRVGLTLPREELNARIALRVEKMMRNGLLEEVKALYLHKKLHALSTVGYTELFDFLEDQCTLEEAVNRIVQNTRQYAKRQMTWFKKDGAYEWFSPFEKEKLIGHIESKLLP